MYKGKEICQGCEITGTENPRLKKEGLCESCKQFLETGKASKIYTEIKYTNVFLHYHAYYTQHVSDFAHSLLDVLQNPTAKYAGGYNDLAERYNGCNGKRYIIDEKLLLPLRQFFKELDSNEIEFKNKIENLPKIVGEAIKDEKNKIFNEGVEKGRELLFSLNNGDLTMDDFSKKITKY